MKAIVPKNKLGDLIMEKCKVIKFWNFVLSHVKKNSEVVYQKMEKSGKYSSSSKYFAEKSVVEEAERLDEETRADRIEKILQREAKKVEKFKTEIQRQFPSITDADATRIAEHATETGSGRVCTSNTVEPEKAARLAVNAFEDYQKQVKLDIEAAKEEILLIRRARFVDETNALQYENIDGRWIFYKRNGAGERVPHRLLKDAQQRLIAQHEAKLEEAQAISRTFARGGVVIPNVVEVGGFFDIPKDTPARFKTNRVISHTEALGDWQGLGGSLPFYLTGYSMKKLVDGDGIRLTGWYYMPETTQYETVLGGTRKFRVQTVPPEEINEVLEYWKQKESEKFFQNYKGNFLDVPTKNSKRRKIAKSFTIL